MEKYIALLRGINVGGNNKVPMAELKALFEREGFAGVSTYINSGNVIFSCAPQGAEALQKRCEAMIEAAFGFFVAVCVISARELAEALDHAPAWWGTNKDSKHNAIFVIPPATPEDIYAQVGQFKPEYEQAAYYGRLIFWSAPMETFSRTRLSRVVGTPVYDRITIRNANTALKLRQLAE
jgi:uncharacterized protein (DUF1697 family)